ncbi:N-acetylmuramic acid 6-phosphate etherase [Granulosicoccus antarcticus]|uniref:N-acetylmuramic acid 6-phosphate etherase n=1 Tax=Granulosicoccus antarcticus IMCC3135 TaxID=1192854 RepID=A0A2Z2NNI1_9GAMM|nr:N-acetylmuramic acid 6-phosphate etherase [Granulosicoccus antarcticus]ASJ70390.1 N-acetylmuramic acid 6-phosphate etherase [Granulosicoccus antarcticus IMCC3135]
MNLAPTESIDSASKDLDLKSNVQILDALLDSQQRAVDAVRQVRDSLDVAVVSATHRLQSGHGRLILAGAGASGRLAVQDGAEMWPTYGWPHERLLLCMAGGSEALLASVEGVEDDADAAMADVATAAVGEHDVVIALAASGSSPWSCAWLEASRKRGALTIGMSNNPDTRLLRAAECPIWLDSGAEVLAGSTRMAAGTAQKIALNLFSTNLMIRMNRTYGNLMVDMAAVNKKLDQRRIRLLQGVLPDVDDQRAAVAIEAAGGWVKLAALVALGDTAEVGRQRLDSHQGSLRAAMAEINA